ncbi:hypothetical protein AMS68_006334 [Peltaster fructicola]|uniref:Heme haloperoxidase family profile domain-containing protein n=1 Tax=Peltaster fructicola TaxID=286661 RepID=A0A6H0Y1G0_9PEZI|nr:hypothetical protein AMS68_006334 [Peltaster fructicola]
MKSAALCLLALPATLAFPGMGSMNKAEIESMLRERAAAEDLEKRQGLGGILGGLGSTITGLLGSVAAEVDLDDLRPEPGYEFQAPGPNDSRGPCPGLNLLANYGYLPRNGYVNYGQVLAATSRGFNMHPDLSTVLSVFAILADGDIATESWYLGAGVNGYGGLNRHSTVEADISPNREDFYNGCGDNHHVSSRMFYQNVELAKSGSGTFDMEVMAAQYAAQAKFAQANNPYLYVFPFPQIVSLGAFAFYPNFFSNGTYGLGGVPNYESISSIIGAEYDASTDSFKYVPERWPKNWYRRSIPYGAVDTLTDGYTQIYPAYPLLPAFAQIGGPNFNVSTALCDVVQGIGSITPLLVEGTAEEIEAATTWAINKLTSVNLTAPFLGCPTNSLSNGFLYPNASNIGGPLSPPPSVVKNSGNNVYNKTYFTSAPVKPQCNHVS